MEWISQFFSNREIATAIWFALIAVYLPLKVDLKEPLFAALKALFQPKLSLLFGTYGIWIWLGAYLLSLVGLWTIFELKGTILWFLFSGAVLLGRAIQHDGDASFFGNILRDQFKVLAVFEFIVVAYSFSLWAELLLVPIVTLLAMVQVVCERDEKFAAVKRLVEWILVGIVVVVVWHFITTTIETKGSLFSYQTLREVSLPVLLSMFSLPIYYLMHCYARWENAAIRIGLKTFQSDELKTEARRAFFRNFFLRPVLLLRAVRQFQSLPAKTSSDLTDIISEVRKYQRLKKSPPDVAADRGWSPYKAELFLAELGLKTNDYHRSGFGEEWFAESRYKFLTDGFPRQTLVYRIQGGENAADELKIKASFQIDPFPQTGLSSLKEAAFALARNAFSLETLPEQIELAIESASTDEQSLSPYVLSVETRRFEEANILDVEFSIRVPTQKSQSE